jgi:DNA-binding MurR/RpiR family transcriptional regulator
MEAVDVAELRDRLGRSLAGLSPRLRKAGRYLLDRPENVALYSMRSVAADAGVHPSTMVRLARELDLAGYNELRDVYRSWLREQHGPFAPRARALQRRRAGAGEDVPDALVAAAHTNISRSFDRISHAQLIACADAVMAAREVYVVGLRSCYPVAFYLHYCLRLVFPRTRLLDGRAGAWADDLRDVSGEDIVIAVSITPYTRETVRAVRYAAENGAAIMALTDSPDSPIARGAAQVLLFETSGPAVLQSIVPALVIAEALVTLLVARGGKAAVAALRRSERQLSGLDAYIDAHIEGASGVKRGSRR